MGCLKKCPACVRQDHINEVFKNIITENEIVKGMGVHGRKNL